MKLAKEMGFCFGVRRAVEMVEKVTADGRPVSVLGALVHNPQVIAELRTRGVRMVASVDEVKNGTLVIPSHGAPPEVFEMARRKALDVVDATCPFVRVAQKAAEELAAEGFQVILLGDQAHTEVKGIVGWAGGKAVVAGDPDEIDLSRLANRVGIMAQTTQPLERLQALANRVVNESLGELKELRVMNTICSATAARQAAAVELAGEVDVMVVVGGKTSANTRRLLEMCRAAGVEAHQVEEAGELDEKWLTGRETVGVTAGASTPDKVTRDVVERILLLGSE